MFIQNTPVMHLLCTRSASAPPCLRGPLKSPQLLHTPSLTDLLHFSYKTQSPGELCQLQGGLFDQ